MPRHPNRQHQDWKTPEAPFTWEHVMVEVLQDIRAELREIKQSVGVLRCHNFIAIPRKLDRMGRALDRLAPTPARRTAKKT